MFFWCPCMAINVNVQYNGGLLPDIILLTQCYLHRGTCLNAMKRFYICSLWSHLKFDIFPPITGGCSEGPGALWFFFKYRYLTFEITLYQYKVKTYLKRFKKRATSLARLIFTCRGTWTACRKRRGAPPRERLSWPSSCLQGRLCWREPDFSGRIDGYTVIIPDEHAGAAWAEKTER